MPADTALQADVEQPSLVLKDLLPNGSNLEVDTEKEDVKPISTVETLARAFEQEALQEPVLQDPNQDLDLLDLAPKKPNWDLKRDLEKKLEELTPKTQAAMAELIRMCCLSIHTWATHPMWPFHSYMGQGMGFILWAHR